MKQLIMVMTLFTLVASCLSLDPGKATSGKIISSDSGPLTFPRHFGSTSLSATSGLKNDSCRAVAVDTADNIYCAGVTNSDLFEVGTNSNDVFIMKLSPSGTVIWKKQFGSLTTLPSGNNSSAEDVRDMVIDLNGDLIIVGNTSGSFAETNSNISSPDGFVLKFDSDGFLVWSKQFGNATTVPGGSNSGSDYFDSVTVDPFNNIIIGGYTSGGFAETKAGLNENLIILQLTSTGSFSWAKQYGQTTSAGGTNTGKIWNARVASDSSGNIFIGGTVAGSFVETASGTLDIFLLKLSPLGVQLWGTQYGNTTLATGTGSNTDSDWLNDIVVTPQDDVILTGNTSSPMLVPTANQDIILAKISAAGAQMWFRQFANSVLGDSSQTDYAYAMSLDSVGNILVAGSTDGSLFDANVSNTDATVIKFDSSGNLLWGAQMGEYTLLPFSGDSTGGEFFSGVAVDSSNDVVAVGQTSGDFLEVNASTLGLFDILAVKVKSNGDLFN